MLALRKALLKRGVNVRENELSEDIDVFILNSIHFDVERFLEFSQKHKLNVIHRIDGPIYLIRGFDREKDELCYRLNAQFASATVLQSAWCYQHISQNGLSAANACGDSQCGRFRNFPPHRPDRPLIQVEKFV